MQLIAVPSTKLYCLVTWLIICANNLIREDSNTFFATVSRRRFFLLR